MRSFWPRKRLHIVVEGVPKSVIALQLTESQMDCHMRLESHC